MRREIKAWISTCVLSKGKRLDSAAQSWCQSNLLIGPRKDVELTESQVLYVGEGQS